MRIALHKSFMTKLKIDYSEARDWYIKGDKEKEGIKYPSLPDIAREFEYSLSTLRKKAANEGWFKKREVREIWSSPITRNELLKKLADNGFTKQDLKSIQTLIEAENSDLFDVLEHIVYSREPIQRATRVSAAEDKIHSNLSEKQKDFIDFVLGKYVEGGVEELDINRLSDLIELKYHTVSDGQKVLGDVENIKNAFIDFQKHLYRQEIGN